MEKKLIALQTIVILPIIIITSAWICTLQRLSDGIIFFGIIGGTFFVYEIYFNNYLLRLETSPPISTHTPIPSPPASEPIPPNPTDINLLRDIRDILKESQDDADFRDFSMVVISLFAGLVALSALLISWVQITSTPGLSSELQSVLGGFGGYIIELEAIFIGLILIMYTTPSDSEVFEEKEKRKSKEDYFLIANQYIK